MKRLTPGAAALFLLSAATAAIAQSYEVSAIDPDAQAVSSAPVNVRPTDSETANYIIDVSGKRVRMIGPRFFPDNSRDVELMGRKEALQRELGEARPMLAAQ